MKILEDSFNSPHVFQTRTEGPLQRNTTTETSQNGGEQTRNTTGEHGMKLEVSLAEDLRSTKSHAFT